MKNSVLLLRQIALVEAISFLVLLGVAMPLKYFAGLPLAVKIAGWIHGVLFILLCAQLWKVRREASWPLSRLALVFVAAMLPFGPFLIDRRLRAWGEDRSQ